MSLLHVPVAVTKKVCVILLLLLSYKIMYAYNKNVYHVCGCVSTDAEVRSFMNDTDDPELIELTDQLPATVKSRANSSKKKT